MGAVDSVKEYFKDLLKLSNKNKVSIDKVIASGGCKMIGDASTYTNEGAYAFIVQEDTVINTLNGGTLSTSTNINYLTTQNLTGITLKAGALFVAGLNKTYNTIDLTSGSIILYKLES